MNYLVIALGVASSITLVISALSVHRLRLLLFGVVTGLLVATQYGLVGAWTGLLTVGIGLAWTGLVAAAYRWPKVAHPALLPVFALGHVVVFARFTDFAQFSAVALVPLVGGLLGLIAVSLKELIYTKAIFVVAGLGWLTYEFSNAVYGQMVGESLNLIANTVAMCALISAKVKGISRRDMVDIDTQLLEVLTGSIHLPHSWRGVENRYPAASLGGRKKPIRGAHRTTSVGYARMTAEYDRARSQMHSEMVDRFVQADKLEKVGKK